MADGDTCWRCGTPLAGRQSHGLCSTCLFASMVGPTPDPAASASDPPPVPAPAADEPPAVIGPYRLRGRLGEGGFGSVYLAEQLEPVRRRVALKILKPGMDSRRVIARFAAERQALAMMEHPNIAKFLDAGVIEEGRTSDLGTNLREVPSPGSDRRVQATESSSGRGTVSAISDFRSELRQGRPYFAMELVEGVPITRYCRDHALGPRARLELFTQVCAAVQHAHQKGIIHRDLKPTNILVTAIDGVPVPKVIDFGIAKATGESLVAGETLHTQFNQFLGTPAYMSPEQATLGGFDIDTRSDIYSLGVLLYELLVGVTPFDSTELLRTGLDEMRRIIREQEPPRPSTRLTRVLAFTTSASSTLPVHGQREFLAAVRGGLDWVVMKCLEKDRARRYASASGLAADIQRHLHHEPVTARPPSALYRFQKLFRRNRVAVLAAGAVAVSIVAGLIVSTALFFGEKRARQRAVAAEQAQDRLRRVAEESRAQVDQANQRMAANLRQLEWRRAEELVAAGKRSDALALWALLSRQQPDDTVLATRLLSALSQRSFAVPRGPAWRHDAMVTVVKFSPRGDC